MRRWKEENLFISISKRTGWTEKGLRGLLKKLSAKLGFKVTCYGFRRYVATKLYEKTNDLRLVSTHLGHTRISTTYRYIQNSSGLNQKGMDIMSE